MFVRKELEKWINTNASPLFRVDKDNYEFGKRELILRNGWAAKVG